MADSDVFTYSDIKKVLKLPDPTLRSALSRLVKGNQVKRVGKGLYTFEKPRDRVPVLLSDLGNNVRDILLETGYSFFVSGLDILSAFLQHIPESFPVLLYTEPSSIEEVRDLLGQKGVLALAFPTTKSYRSLRESAGKEIVLIYPTKEFQYANDGLASVEKAFIDLYYATTREEYPFSVQELARLYLDMQRSLSTDLGRLTKIASRRSIEHEISDLVRLSLSSKDFEDLRNFFSAHKRTSK